MPHHPPGPAVQHDELERELADLQAQYRALVENAVEGFFRTTPDGRFLMANTALAHMLGYDSAEQLLTERTDLEHRHYVRRGERARFRRLLEMQGLVHGFEYEVYRRNGSIVWLRDHVRVVRDADGRTVCYEGTVEDITNRKQAEALLDLRAREQAAVARFGAAAVAGTPVPDLLDCAATLLAETLGVEYTQILELGADGRFSRRAGMGWSFDLEPAALTADPSSQADLTLVSGHPVLVHDLAEERRFRPPHYLLDHGVVSGLSVRIGTVEHPWGVLAAYTRERRAFTPDDVNFLESLANLLAAAIERRRGEEVRQHLLARAISAQEEERTRIARELHDETGQALTAILLGLRNIADADTPETKGEIVAKLRDLTEATIRDVGRIARGLRPSTLDDLGLVPALRRYADEIQDARGVPIAITESNIGRLPPPIETTLYRIVQEALTNAARHAGAQAVHVAIDRRERHVQVTIRDDGRGFDVAAALGSNAGRRSLGLVGMRERASLLGGTVEISSGATGSTIVVALPLEPAG
jgi:PAS domain S-box-containing protein